MSLFYARSGLSFAQRLDDKRLWIKPFNVLGKALLTTYQDSSFYYYNMALKLSDSLNETTEKPELFYNLANIYLNVGEYKTSLSLLNSSITLAVKHKNFAILSDAFNLSGMIDLEVGDSNSALKKFKNALTIAKDHNLSKQTGNALANIAIFEIDTTQSIAILKRSIQYLIKGPGTEEETAYALINLGIQQINPDSAIYYYQSALKQVMNYNLPLVQLGAYNNMSYSFIAKGNFSKARECLVERAIPIASKINNLDWLGTLYDSYSELLEKSGDYQKAYVNVRKSIEYRENFNLKKDAEKVRLLAIILDVKNKEIELNQNESVIKERSDQNRLLKLLLIILFLIALGITILFINFKQKIQLKIRQQQISSARRIIEIEEKEKNRIGFELHDNIGYLIRVLDGFIESIEIPDKQVKASISEQLNELGNCIRRIAHRINLVNDNKSTIQEIFTEIITDMKDLTGIKIKYFVPGHLPEISNEIILHLCRILQELLTNSSKYAPTSNIEIDLGVATRTLILLYRDDGPGFDAEVERKKGMGLDSIYERIILLGGEARLNTTPGNGTKWEISVPII